MKAINKFIVALKAEMGAKNSVTRKTVAGGFWTISASLGYKVVGIIRTVVLARLLAPNDFGLFGIAMVVISGFNIFTETGANTMLIQKKDVDDRYWSTGWTIGIFRGCILFAALWLASGFIADFYNRPNIVTILRVLSFMFLLQGFSNIGLVNLQKTMRFKRKVAIDQISELLGNVTAIILGMIYLNVWALVAGKIITSLCLFLCSYIFIETRPKFSFDPNIVREFLSFGQSVFAATILVYIITSFDDLIVGKVLGITTLGFYTMAYNIANLPTINISRTIAQVTLPAYSQIKEDLKRIERAFIRVYGYNLLACVPVSIGLLILAPEIVEVVLGEKWLPMLPAFRILCLLGLFRGTASIIGPLFMSMGRPDYLRNIKIWEFVVFAPLIYPSAIFGGIIGVSMLTTGIYLLSLIMHLHYAKKLLPEILQPCMEIMGLIGISTLAMSIALILEKLFLFPQSNAFGLSMMIMTGIIVYLPLALHVISKFLSRYLSQ